MKVYVLTVGCYEDVAVRGAFASPEAAMAAYTPAESARMIEEMLGEVQTEPHAWEVAEPGWWTMAYGCADIREYEVRGAE